MATNGKFILLCFVGFLFVTAMTDLFFTDLNIKYHHKKYNSILSKVPIHRSLYQNINGDDRLLNMKPKVSDRIQSRTVLDLIQRVLPYHYQWFEVVVDRNFTSGHLDRFKIETRNNMILIIGSSGVSASNGFHYYLNYLTNSSVSWSGDQVNNILQNRPPMPERPIEMVIKEKFRYYQNACTFSYSSVWWNWTRWQQELDWMALHGINLPLAFNGQEMVFRRTFMRFNFTKAEVDEYFTGPAYLAWNRMGNIQTWGGPLTDHWHRTQMKLQKQILERMRNFGMFSVVPGFSGHVPRHFQKKMPTAKIDRLTNWNRFGSNFSETYFLQPEDPMFVEIGKVFIEEYIDLYGTDHFYNIDMFMEETPTSSDVEYLRKCGEKLYQSIEKADPNGIWLMQAYPFMYDKFWGPDQVEAIVTSVPQNKLILLDLVSEAIPIYPQFNGYYGQPFIWCMLHNYGAVNGMFGAMNRINNEVYAARKKYSNMLGIGMAPEGIEQNPVIYDFMSEVTWYDHALDLDEWVSRYALRRYGFTDDRINQAWKLLRKSVYHDPIGIKNHGRYAFIMRPRPNLRSMLWYDPRNVSAALQYLTDFVHLNPHHLNSDTFVYDLVDVTRQTLQLLFDHYYQKIDDAFTAKNLITIDIMEPKLLKMLDLTEEVLQACKQCLLHNWIDSARQLGNDSKEQDLNEWQARTQISIWGPRGSRIANYAAKHWSGMFKYLYKPRWQLYLNEIRDCIQNNRSFDGPSFKHKLFEQIEFPFTNAMDQALVREADVSNLLSNVEQVVAEARITIDQTFNFRYYYNDTERWLE